MNDKGVVDGMLIYKTFINSSTQLVYCEGNIDLAGGISVINLYSRIYNNSPINVVLYISNKIAYRDILGNSQSRFRFYYQVENKTIRIKITSSGNLPFIMYGLGHNTYITLVNKVSDFDVTGYELAEEI